MLNDYYVPVYVSNDESEDQGAATATEKALRKRIMFEAKKSGLTRKASSINAKDSQVFRLAPEDGGI